MLKPYSNKTLKRLPRNAYAYSADNGASWVIRQDAETVETVVARDNAQALTPSDYYAMPVDAVIVAEVVARSLTVAKQIEMAYNG